MSQGGTADRALDFFRDRFGLDERRFGDGLGTALERRVDYADLFFEYTTHDAVVLEESIVKSGERHIEQGVGVRARAGERQGYAHSDEISTDSVSLAAAHHPTDHFRLARRARREVSLVHDLHAVGDREHLVEVRRDEQYRCTVVPRGTQERVHEARSGDVETACGAFGEDHARLEGELAC